MMLNMNNLGLGILFAAMFSSISTASHAQHLDVTIRELNTYENLTDPGQIIDHPLKNIQVRVTAILISHPRNSGLAAYTAAGNSIGRIHTFVVDTNALAQGLDGQYMQLVAPGATLTVLEELNRGDIITVEGRLTFFASGQGYVSQFDPTSIVLVGSANTDAQFEKFLPLLEPTVVTPADLNVKNPDGTFSYRMDNYTTYINRYVRIENTRVINRLVANTARPWMYVGDDVSTILTTDTSLRFRNDRSAYRAGYNNRRSEDGAFAPPPPGSVVNLSGFIVMNNFNVDGRGADNYKIVPWDDGVVWVPGEAEGTFVRVSPEGWPNDLVIVPENPIDLESGLVAYYPFNGNAEDESGNGLDGTVTGQVVITNDRFGIKNKAYQFPGESESFIDVGSPQLLMFDSEITISVWFYMEGGYYNPRLLQFGNAFYAATEGTNNSERRVDIGFADYGLSAGVLGGRWVNLIYVGNRKDGIATLYIDGEQVESRTSEAPNSELIYNSNFNIGRMAHPAFDAWGGKLDDIRIYNRALSPAEVAALYELESTPPPLAPDEIADIDGNRYKTVRIGDQVWMAENLRTSRYQDGTPIPNVMDGTQWSQLNTGSWAYYNNDPVLGEVYGKLYNGFAAKSERNICPVGWTVPTDEEWTVLSNFLGADAGFKMKSAIGWANNGNGSNESGFNGLPSGYRLASGQYVDIDDYGYFWSSTTLDLGNSWDRFLSNVNVFLNRSYSIHTDGLSIRCVRPYSSQTASSDTWTLPVRATTSAGLSSTANLGVSPSASDGLDSLDVPKPPTPPGAHIQLYTDRPEWNSPLGRRVGTDIKASVDLSAVPTSWTLYLSSSDMASGEMVLDRPAELNWPIVVLKGDERHVSRSGDLVIPFSFASGGTQSFHVHVGDTTAPGLQAGSWFEGPAILDASQTHPLSWLSGDENQLVSVELSVSHDDGATWDSLHTSVASSFDWTPSPSIVFNESTRFRLTAIDRADNSTTITTLVPVSLMAPRQPVSRPQGWSLSGAPFINANDALSTLGEAFRFAWTGVGYEQVFGFETGRGQWTGAFAAITDTLAGTVATQSQSLSLPAGWNLVASPLLRSIYADSVTVTHNGNGRTLPLPAAVDSMWVTASLGYDGSAYATSARMEPFDGYWMGVLAPSVTLELPIHAYSTIVSKESTQSEPMVRVQLKDGDSEQILSVKQGTGVPAPPPAPNGERIGLKGQPTLLGDLYLIAGASQETESAWPLVIGGTPRDVTLSWTDQDFAGMTAVLDLPDRRYDLTRANTVSLRSDESAQIVVGPISTSTEPGSETPLRTELMAAYPNPFNPNTVVSYRLSVSGNVRLAVYDVLGRQVAILADGNISAGTHQVTFDASGLASGVYIYRLEAAGEVFTRRMTLIK